LSDQDGDAWFYVDPNNKGKSRLVSPAFEGAQRIPARSTESFLKELNPKKIDLLKIDVEGHEETILRSAKDQLSVLQPKIILFEGNQGPALPAGGPIGSLLNDIGYSVYGLKKRLRTLALELPSQSNRSSYNDYVAVSRSKRIPSAAMRAFGL
jgi:hypothetical protein